MFKMHEYKILNSFFKQVLFDRKKYSIDSKRQTMFINDIDHKKKSILKDFFVEVFNS
jgi:hypothetical protein